MGEWEKYRRTNIAEMRPYVEGEMYDHHSEWDHRISISDADRDNGSPKIGDMIARNPQNHDDQWLVARVYFEENFGEAKPTAQDEGEEKSICPYGAKGVHECRACAIRTKCKFTPKPTAPANEGEVERFVRTDKTGNKFRCAEDEEVTMSLISYRNLQAALAEANKKVEEYEKHSGTVGRSVKLLMENNRLKDEVAEKEKELAELKAKYDCFGTEDNEWKTAAREEAHAADEARKRIAEQDKRLNHVKDNYWSRYKKYKSLKAKLRTAEAVIVNALDAIMNMQPHIGQLPKNDQSFIDTHIEHIRDILNSETALSKHDEGKGNPCETHGVRGCKALGCASDDEPEELHYLEEGYRANV